MHSFPFRIIEASNCAILKTKLRASHNGLKVTKLFAFVSYCSDDTQCVVLDAYVEKHYITRMPDDISSKQTHGESTIDTERLLFS